MPIYGMTIEGFVVKPLQAIKDDLGAGFRGVFGTSFDLEAESVNGQVIGIFADRLADLWQLGKSIYDAGFTDTATGVQLDNLLALTGIARKPATKSLVSVLVTGTPATVVATGALVISVTNVGTKFKNVGVLTVGVGGTVTQTFESVLTGPRVAPANTLTQIDTPTAGITSVNNVADQSALGTDIETDPAARIRRELTLRAIGSASAEAIRALVADITLVTDCVVFENESEITDPQGVPGHSIEVVVSGGATLTIAQTIFNSKAAGVGTYGTSSSNAVVGPDGLSRTVYFSRPAVVPIYHAISVRVDSALYPSDGDIQIKNKVALWGDLNLRIGTDVTSSPIIPTIFTIPGVLEVVSLPNIGLAASPGTAVPIVISNRQIGDFDTSRITVTVVP